MLIHLHPHIHVNVPPLGLPVVPDDLQGFLPFSPHVINLGETQIVIVEQYIGVSTILVMLPRVNDSPASMLLAKFL